MLEFKNDFIHMKSLLSHKRKPDEKVENILEKLENNNTEKKEAKKEEVINEENKDIININEENNNKDNKNNEEEKKKETVNKTRIKKIIKKSNNNKKKEEKQENQNKEKEEGNTKQKPTNKNISDYFNFSGKKEPNQVQTDLNSEDNKNIINNTDTNQINNEENKKKEMNPKDSIKEINNYINNKNNIFSLDNNNITKYDKSYINEINNIPEKIKDYYLLDNSIINENNKKEYLLKLKNYFLEYNSLNNIGQHDETNTQNKKLIFIHDSFAPLKKIPAHPSHLINPKNFLAKDEYLIDYEKDSEDEFMEENAEDIKSNDNEDNEEEEEEDANSQQDDKFIVPDGHLSEEEVSDKDIMEERQLFENSTGRNTDIMNILNIRKNFTKPVLIDFSNIKKTDEKFNVLLNKLTIGLFNYQEDEKENLNENSTNNINTINNNMEIEGSNDQENKNNSFPIIIGSKVSKYKGIEDSIKIHFEDILRKVHGSYETKEHLISELNKKFEDISKKTLNTFFKEKCYKIQKRYWMVNNDTLSQFNLKAEDIENYKKENFEIYKKKEEKKKKELEEIKIKDGIIQPPSQEENQNQNNEGGTETNNEENKNEKDKDKEKTKEKKLKAKSKSRSKKKLP